MFGCGPGGAEPPAPPTPTSSLAPLNAGPPFVEVAEASGLAFRHWNGMTGRMYYSEVMGAGVALFDADGDGDLDVFFPQGALLDPRETPADAVFPPPPRPGGRFFRNDSPGGPDAPLVFVDATEASGIDARGYGMGAATGDADGDGDTDLLLTSLGKVELWANDGDGTFADASARAGIADSAWTAGATFFDFDRDGDLDLFLVRYLEFSAAKHAPCHDASSARIYCGPKTYRALPDRLLENRGDGTFRDVSKHAGFAARPGPGLGVVAFDADGDGRLDLYVTNDGAPNFLWRNRGDGTFEEIAEEAGAAVPLNGVPHAGMGLDAADFDGDGDDDLVVTNLEGETNTLYVNRGGDLLTFADRTPAAGLAAPSLPMTGFGVAFLDFDRDGLEDFYVANGAIRRLPELERLGDPYPLRQPNQLFRHEAPGRFRDVSTEAGEALAISEVSRGVAVGDLDGDGDPDLVVSNNQGPVRLLRNQAASGRWLGVEAVTGAPPRPALGARVRVAAPGARTQVKRVRTDGSYLSASDPRVLVGLGGASGGEAEVRVRWVDGRVESFAGLALDRYHRLVEGAGRAVAGWEEVGGREEKELGRAEGGAGADEAAVPSGAGSVGGEGSAAVGHGGEDRGAAGPARVEPEPIPEPSLAPLEERVRAQIRARRAAVEAARSGEREALGRAYGELGRLYHAYLFLDAAIAAYGNAGRLDPGELRWAYLGGAAALAAGRSEVAVERLEAALALRPEDVAARARLAQALLAAGRLEEARRECDRLVERAPWLAFAHALAAEVAVQEGDNRRAIAGYREALRLEPAATGLAGPLAVALRAEGDAAGAARERSRAGTARPALPDPEGDAVAALADSSAKDRERGQAAFSGGRFEEATKAFAAALASRPDDPALWVNLGSARSALGDPQGARAAYEKALAIDPGHVSALFNLGVLAAAGGDDEAAIPLYRRALAGDPAFADARLNLANALARRGEPAAALLEYRRMAAQEPGRAAARLGLVRTLAALGRTGEALAEAETGHRLAPDDRPLAVALARLLASDPDRGRRDGARALALARAAFAAERNLDHLEALAMAHAAAGDFAEAVRWQQAAVDVARRAGRLEAHPHLEENLGRYVRSLPAERAWPGG